METIITKKLSFAMPIERAAQIYRVINGGGFKMTALDNFEFLKDGTCQIFCDARNREEWLEKRREGIGGSDAGAVIGINKYKSPMMVYLEKKGILKTEDTPAMQHGRRMEPVLKKEFPEIYMREYEGDVFVYNSDYMYQSTIYPFMLATLDGIVKGRFGEAGLEIKTASVFEKKEWGGDNIPDPYYAQVQHYMIVTGLKQFFVLALVGAEIILKRIPYNSNFAGLLIKKEKQFWEENVLKDQIPAPIGLPGEDDIIEMMFAGSDETVSIPELESKAEEYLKIHEQIKDLEELKRKIQQEIKLKIGNAKVCFAGGHKITWSRYQQVRIDMDKLKAEAPDIYERYSKTIETSRLLIK